MDNAARNPAPQSKWNKGNSTPTEIGLGGKDVQQSIESFPKGVPTIRRKQTDRRGCECSSWPHGDLTASNRSLPDPAVAPQKAPRETSYKTRKQDNPEIQRVKRRKQRKTVPGAKRSLVDEQGARELGHEKPVAHGQDHANPRVEPCRGRDFKTAHGLKCRCQCQEQCRERPEETGRYGDQYGDVPRSAAGGFDAIVPNRPAQAGAPPAPLAPESTQRRGHLNLTGPPAIVRKSPAVALQPPAQIDVFSGGASAPTADLPDSGCSKSGESA